jgi:hypothetical protein
VDRAEAPCGRGGGGRDAFAHGCTLRPAADPAERE